MKKKIDKNFPCIVCGCAAKAHFTSIIDKTLGDICGYCIANAFNAHGSDRDTILNNAVHDFEGNGLKFLEEKYAYKK